MTDFAAVGNKDKRWLRTLIALSLVVAFVVAGHLLPGLTNSDIHRQIRNALHIIGFAAVAAAVFEVLPVSKWKAAIITVLLIGILGGLAEVLQGAAGKEFDAVDLLRDFAGALLYLAARLCWPPAGATRKSYTIRRIISVLVVALAFVPVIYWLSARAMIVSRYPVILDFSGRWDSRLFYPINSYIVGVENDDSRNGFVAAPLRIRLLRRKWSGMRIEVVDADWSAYEFLSFEAASATDDEIRVNVELSDGEHPGFRSQHLLGGDEVGSEPTRIRVSLRDEVSLSGRPVLDTSRIRQIYIIGRNSGENAELLLADIRLE